MLSADSGRTAEFVPPPKRNNLDLCALWRLLSLLQLIGSSESHVEPLIHIQSRHPRKNTHQPRTSQPSVGGSHIQVPLCSCCPSSVLMRCLRSQQPAVVFDQRYCVVSCHCNFANLQCTTHLRPNNHRCHFLQPPHCLFSPPECWKDTLHSKSCQSHRCSTVHFTQ